MNNCAALAAQNLNKNVHKARKTFFVSRVLTDNSTFTGFCLYLVIICDIVCYNKINDVSIEIQEADVSFTLTPIKFGCRRVEIKIPSLFPRQEPCSSIT